MHHDLHAALERHGGVVSRRSHPDLLPTIKSAQRSGLIEPVLPGVLVAREQPRTSLLAARAAQLWRADAVVVGAAAAALTFWPELRVPVVEVALQTPARCRRPGFAFAERMVPGELVGVVAGVRVSLPALTALDLVATMGGDGIDRALRVRVVTLDSLHRALALTGGRRGNVDRRAMLLDSRDRPWSAAERKAHRLLRLSGLTGWKSNVAVTFDDRTFFLDIAFEDLKIAIEIDGRQFHGEDSENFEADRWRQNLLVLHGWTVLRFTWRMLVDEPGRVIAQILQVHQTVGSMR